MDKTSGSLDVMRFGRTCADVNTTGVTWLGLVIAFAFFVLLS